MMFIERNFDLWNFWGAIVAYAIAGVGVVFLFYHLLMLIIISEPKKKYDYISKNEVNMLLVASYLFLAAIGAYANTLVEVSAYFWYIIRIFITIMVGVVFGSVVFNVFKVYYPAFIERRLKKLRYKPRVNPETGNTMKLLSEEEEDVYLNEGMQAEENIFSIDYDVWIDEQTGYTKIERYAGHLRALKCPECNFQTLKVVEEEILESPTVEKPGQLMKFYECTYCSHESSKLFKIAKLKEADLEEEDEYYYE